MKYLKKSFHIEVMYMEVNKIETFYKGLAVTFNKNESKLKMIDPDCWLDLKSSGYLTEEISKEQFDNAFEKALKLLKRLKK
ncbi:hypothetical protein [Soonwooa sp.]|uniref:hypothetical protein n=1 Tax=Soonwooa sp. TaxID=1938592 RepID=UPI0028AFB439|nr:hypothetical protein [Soonwooa sp.]